MTTLGPWRGHVTADRRRGTGQPETAMRSPSAVARERETQRRRRRLMLDALPDADLMRQLGKGLK